MNKNYGLSFFKSIFLSLVLVQPNVLATQGPEQTNKNQKLQHQLHKKWQLIDYILTDIEKKSAELFSSEPMFADSFNYTKNELSLAKQALNNGNNKAAKEHLDQAFINMTYARSFIQKPLASIEVSLAEYNKLQHSIIEFQQSLVQTLEDKSDTWGLQQQRQVNKLVRLANNLLEQKNTVQAKAKLDDAYRILVMTLSRLKDKQTTTITLDFATPKDEYEYELKRLNSFQMLVRMRKTDSKLSTKAIGSIEKYQANSALSSAQALTSANDARYEQAIKLLEDANEQLKRALRKTGLNIL